ncbi:MAG: tRNA (N6-isopentenyl adenosine(37)-C2)-methylthiotransferase MiaB [Lentisphaerae bacterium GWF2_44_16]|nr:MAG: tRNA (N6-isopentenyl adenosine(37)-C2)-methylthiotransferase MiaB [Lentisphaerae bacterium GWF2_44_16]
MKADRDLKVYIKTFGCQMNERDSESAAALLSADAFSITDSEKDADILIFNTCSVRDQAERKAIGKIGILKRLKRSRPHIFIGIMGCMAQSRGAELLKEIPHLDFVIGTGQLHRLPEIIKSEIRKRHKTVFDELARPDFNALAAHLADTENNFSASIAVMTGCNRFCSYCIVPYVRGREHSRPPDEIIEEAEKLVASGVREILLLGQNIAAYGLDGKSPPKDAFSPFAELLEKLNNIDGLYRIRFTSPHPAYFNDRLIDAVTSLPKICESIHLPLQSGSDRILKLMNRPYTSAHYMSVVNKLKSKSPRMIFSTDVIVGFPGETEDDFNATRGIMNEVAFDNAFIFKYSKRRDTLAAEMPEQLEQKIKEERNKILLEDLAERTGRYNASLVGKILEVMAEGPSKRNSSRWAGRSSSNKIVIFEPESSVSSGSLINVKIERSTPMTLFGKIQVS